MKHYLAMCLAFRNEAPYLREWIELHRLVGFERFYLYDNLSADGPLEVLRPYIDAGIVVYHEWNDPRHPHRWGSIEIRLDCCRRYGSESFWIAFIDADEFLFATHEDESVADVLRGLEAYPGVGVNWLLFGDGGQKKRGDEPVIERFVLRQSVFAATEFKTIARPQLVAEAPNPHFFLFNDGGFAVNEHGVELRGVDKSLAFGGPPLAFSYPASYDRLRINHYITKSREEFDRFKRLKDDLHGRTPSYTTKYFDTVQERCNRVEDRMIQRYLPKLKQALAHD